MSAPMPRRAQGTPSGGLSRVPYLPGLDGLRALAVLGVMIYHANHTWLKGGFLGVEVFFVISGYLITLLLIGEHERTGRIDLAAFWRRRFRRLLPALYVMMAIVVVYLTAFYTASREASRGDVVAGVFYVSNWYQILVGQGYAAAEAFVPFRHLWSLAVEEQFYLLWPLVMVVLLRRARGRLPSVGVKLLGVSLLIAIATGVVFHSGDVYRTAEKSSGFVEIAGRVVNINDMLYLGSFSRAGGLMLGAGFAMLWRPMAISRGPLRRRGGMLDILAVVGLAALVYLMVTVWFTSDAGDRYNAMLFRGGFLLTGLATLLLIAAVTHQGAATGRLLGNPLLLWIGTRSYGLYLFHWPVYQFIRKEAGVGLGAIELVAAALITVPLTELSYRFVETPIRTGRAGDLRRRLTADVTRVAATVSVVALVGLATFSMVVADPQCVGAIGCSVAGDAEGDAGAIDGGNGTVDPSASTVVGATSTTAVKKPPRDYVAIGESVMEGAAVWMEGAGINTFAREGRGPEGAKNAVIKYRDLGYIGTATVLVIQVGHNAPMGAAEVAAIMAEVPADAGTVWFMTLNGQANWIESNNTLLRSLPTTYPNVKIIDWNKSASGTTLCSDGMHLTCDGNVAAQYYTNIILTQLGLPTL